MKLLKKGLKFTPTPSANTEELEVDIQKFCRKLRLVEFFADKETEDDESLIRNKSKFTPKKGRNRELDEYIDSITKFPLQPKSNVKRNISKREQQAIKRLQTDSSIVIKEADKGGAIVIMDSSYYENLVNDQLSDRTFYAEIPSNMDKKTTRRLNNLISKHEQSLTEKESDCLVNFESRTSNFYGLPKVHKSKQIQSAVKEQNSEYVILNAPTDLKLRPIIAGPSCPTNRLSNLIDIILKPLCTCVPSFIRDDIHFLSKLPERSQTDCTLVTFDVSSLYTNIPHDLGISAIKYWVEKHRDKIDERFTLDFILDSVKFILENNTFYFNGTNYIQIKGTAMGTKFAPTYATLVMGYLEQKLYQNIEEKYGIDIARYIETSWFRFLDDCFIIWTESADLLEEFTTILNNLHPSIKFTRETNKEKIPFLDILVKVTNGTISTNIYYKETDTHQYLNFKSCHPTHTKRNIPFCLARKICTVVSNIVDRDEKLAELSQFLMKQRYPRTLIENALERAKSIPIAELRATHDVEVQNDKIPFVVTHNPCNTNIFEVAQINLPIISQNTKLKELINKEKLLSSKRQPPNLKRLLTRAKFDRNHPKPTFSVSKCNDSRCGTCAYIHTGTELLTKDGTRIFPNENMNCKSGNLIYCIQCSNCSEIYIGQTGNILTQRMTIHRQQIREPRYRKIPLSKHLDECGCGVFKIFPFYKLHSSDSTLRDIKENNFIKKFKPFLNRQ